MKMKVFVSATAAQEWERPTFDENAGKIYYVIKTWLLAFFYPFIWR